MFEFVTARRFHGLVAFAAFALLAVAFYMEYQMGLEPCPLCMMLFSSLGAALAMRHLYLQSLPADELPACLPGLSYMFEVFPWQEIMESMIMGTGECGDVVWTFLGLSIPAWTLVAFAGMAIVNIWIAIQSSRTKG